MYVYFAIALLSAALSFGGAWKVQNWRHAAQDKARLELEAEQRRLFAKGVDVAAVDHERDRREIRTEFITITQEVERVVKEPFYVDGQQCLDDAGLRALTAAIGSRAAASQPARAVPGSRSSD